MKYCGYINLRATIVGEEKLNHFETILSKEVDDSRLFVQSSNIPGIYRIGCEQLKDGIYHKAGYVWSSRAEVMNEYFGTELVDATYNDYCCCIDKATLESLIDTNEIEKTKR